MKEQFSELFGTHSSVKDYFALFAQKPHSLKHPMVAYLVMDYGARFLSPIEYKRLAGLVYEHASFWPTSLLRRIVCVRCIKALGGIGGVRPFVFRIGWFAYAMLKKTKVHQSIGLLLINRMNIHKLRAEILDERRSIFWFANMARQHAPVHANTMSIFLKRPGAGGRNFHDLTSDPVDTIQVGAYTIFAERYPQTMMWVENFARTHNAELGRVALVALAPGGYVYAHTDSNALFLRGFDRYHLVVDSPRGSFHTAGGDWGVFQTGDLFFLDNHTIHAAHNMSTRYWRIHLIIDIRPLDGSGRGRQVSDLSDWRWFDGNS